MCLLTWKVPEIASGLVSGSPNMTAGGMMQAGRSMMGAAATGLAVASMPLKAASKAGGVIADAGATMRESYVNAKDKALNNGKDFTAADKAWALTGGALGRAGKDIISNQANKYFPSYQQGGVIATERKRQAYINDKSKKAIEDGKFITDDKGEPILDKNNNKQVLPSVMKEIQAEANKIYATRGEKLDAILESRYKSNQANKKGNQNLLKKNQDQSQYDNLKTIMQRGHIPQGEQGIGSLPD